MPMVTGEELAMAVAPVGRDELIVDLFRRRGQALIGLARALVDSREEAEEVVQEAFARLVASFVRIDDSGRADRYLTVTVLNVARSRLRRRRTAREKDHLLRARDGYLDESSSYVVEAVVKAADGLGWTPLEVALAWVRDRPGVAAPIVGARTAAQLRQALAVEERTLPSELMEALDDASAGRR